MRRNCLSVVNPALVILLLPTLFYATQTPWKGKIYKEGDVTVVQNPRDPIYKSDVLTLKEELTIGGANAKEQYVLAQVDNLVVDETGAIYALDTKDICVKVYGRSGAFLRTIGRKGEGPGEYTRPYGIAIDKKNQYLIVQDARIGFIVFDHEGKFIKNIQNDYLRPVQKAIFDPQGNLVINRIKIQDMEHRWDELKRFGPNMMLLAEIRSIPIGSPYDVVAPMVTWDLDAKGNIVYGFPARYEIEIIGDRNQIIKKIQNESDPVELTLEEKERIAQIIKVASISPDLAAKFYSSKYHSAFIAIHVAGDGHIFVTTWKKNGKNNLNDVFDKEGRFLAEIALPSRRIFIAGDYLYTIEEDQEGYSIIKRYAMNWNYGNAR
jgi:hypothetical protein